MGRRFMIFLLMAALVTMLAACAEDDGGNPAKAVTDYLQAKVQGDEDALRGLLCAEMEGDLQREANSFAAVDAKIQDLSCTRDGDTDRVTCEGEIVAVYGGEDRAFPLGTYRVVEEDGTWKFCGETG